jgi:hypothetical protein
MGFAEPVIGPATSGRTRWLNPSYGLHVSFYNLCRVHETLRNTPAMALGIADRVWTIGDLLDAALTAMPPLPTPTAPDRRRQFRVIEGGRK